MKIVYQSPDELPEKMRLELAQAEYANEAEEIFRRWAETCFIEPRSRSHVWQNA